MASRWGYYLRGARHKPTTVSGATVHRVLTLLLAGLLVATAISGAAGASPTAPAAASVDGGGEVVSVVAANNTTAVRHENPANVSRRGDLGMLQRWLAGRMGQVLVDCTEGARARKWGACDVNGSYPEWLSKYVDVARETDSTNDDNTTDSFRNAWENQQRFNDRVREFYETYEQYQQARENGNTARARRLARELRRLQTQVDGIGDRLVGNYSDISRNTNVNLTDTAMSVQEMERNVTATTESVTRDVFVATTLSARASDTAISFADPLEVTGQLTTPNGTVLANRQIRVAIGTRRIETTTDADGNFTATYRPTTVPLETEQVTVRYLPRNDSIYLSSEASVPVTIEQVATELSVSASPGTVAFDESVRLAGEVSAAGDGAGGVPVDLYIGDTKMATVRTDASGSYRYLGRLPAAIEPGDQTVRAVVPLENRALVGSSAQAPLSVESTPTSITLNTTHIAPRDIRVMGTLSTAAERGLSGRSIEIRLNSTTLENVQTRRDGSYVSTLELPSSVPRNATVTVRVQFDGRKTNLDSATNRTALSISARPPPDTSAGASGIVAGIVETLDLLGATSSLTIVAVLGLIAGAVLLARRYRATILRIAETSPEPTSTAPDEPSITDAPGDTFPVNLPEVDENTTTPTLVELAEQHISQGDADAGTIASYAALRRTLATRVGPSGALTHWEFYSTCQDEVVEAETIDSLREATEAYEQAAFAPSPVSTAHARRVLELVRSDDSPGGQPGE